jgi:AbiV family abortive infection protein
MGEWNASLRVHLEVAQSAVANADQLARGSDCLLKSGFFGPAAALAIIGQEEAGKAVLYTMIGFGLVPEDAVPSAINRARHHQSKQLLGSLGHALAQIAPRIRPHIDRIPDSLETREEVVQPLLSDLVSLVDNLVRSFFAEHPDFERRLTRIAENSPLQNLKHRGLYADGERSVSEVSVQEASEALADLRFSIEGIQMFTQIAEFTDEGVRFTRALLEPHLQFANGSEP